MLPQYHIEYTDFNGKKTSREISDITAVAPEFADNTFEAFCHLRNERRHFVYGRIRKAVDLRTGNKIDPIDLLPKKLKVNEFSPTQQPISKEHIMSYTMQTLTAGEDIKYEGKIHWVVFLGPIFWLIVSIICFSANSAVLGVMLLALAIIMGISNLILAKTSEFVITSKRVIMKTGLIKRNSLDVQLSKMESFSVDQSILGRILNYGKLVVGGSGGARGGFANVSNPLEFRRMVQVAADAVK